jgi:hypothetical protein
MEYSFEVFLDTKFMLIKRDVDTIIGKSQGVVSSNIFAL